MVDRTTVREWLVENVEKQCNKMDYKDGKVTSIKLSLLKGSFVNTSNKTHWMGLLPHNFILVGIYSRENGTMAGSGSRCIQLAHIHATVQWNYVFYPWSSRKFSCCDDEPWGRVRVVNTTIYGGHRCNNICSWFGNKCLEMGHHVHKTPW